MAKADPYSENAEKCRAQALACHDIDKQAWIRLAEYWLKLAQQSGEPATEPILRIALKTLQETVAGVNLDSFIVRQHRRAVERYRASDAWKKIDDEKRKELIEEIAPLPTAHRLGTEEAKRFDLLMFSLELALLKGSNRFLPCVRTAET
jgi:hypothetical protein